MLDLETHILLYAPNGDLTSKERRALAAPAWMMLRGRAGTQLLHAVSLD